MVWFLSRKGIEQHEVEKDVKDFMRADLSGEPMLAKIRTWLLTHKGPIGMGFLAFAGWVYAGCGTIDAYGVIIDPLHLIDNVFTLRLSCNQFVFPTVLAGVALVAAGFVPSDYRHKIEAGIVKPPAPPAPKP